MNEHESKNAISQRLRRVMFVIARGDAFGGSSLHVMDMATRLEEDGIQVRILIGGEDDMEVPVRFAARGLDFQCVSEMRREIHPITDMKALVAIRSAVREFQPDLVSLHASKAGALGRLACFRLGVPILYTPHCWSFVDGFPKAWLYQWLEKLLAPLADRIVTVCENERRFGLARGVGSETRTRTIHNGVRDSAPIMDREPGSSAEPLRIVMVGRFEHQKNQAQLLEALSALRELPWRLTLVGNGPLLGNCLDLVQQLGIAEKVEFQGYCDAVEDLLVEHDVFALITHWEGFPRSVLEAMGASLPVVVTDVGGSREALVDGETGHLIGRDDVDALVRVLAGLIADRGACEEMGRKGRLRFLERFTFERMYGDYLELYTEIIHGFASNSTKRMQGHPRPVTNWRDPVHGKGSTAKEAIGSSER